MNGASQWIALLLASLVRPFVLVAAAGLVLRIFRVRHPASRHAVWSVVLFAMLLLPIVSVLAPHWSLPASPSMEESPVFLAPEPIQPIQPPQTISLPSQPAPSKISLSTLIVRFYLAGLFAMLLYRAVGWMMLRRVIARSTPIKGRALRESADVIAPVALGVLRPAVILPTGWRDWNAETRCAVLAHEFAHIRRNDTLISALARFTKSVLWFHPLAWWTSRRVAELAELACDAVALESLQDPGKYSRILLDFASGVNRAGYRVALPGLAMAASSSGMGRRIDQVFELADGSARKLARPGALLALIGLPVMCLAATVGLRESNTPLQLPPIVLPKTPELRIIAQEKAPQEKAAQSAPVPTTLAQSKAAPPKFEVAAVKPCKPADVPHGRGGAGGSDPGQIRIVCQTVERLVQWAYVQYANGEPWSGGAFPLPPNQPIEGGPSWVKSEAFTIDAKPENPQTVEMMRGPMLRALLEDRFKLKTHRGTRQVPIYALVVAKGGPKLNAAKKDSCTAPPDFSPLGPEQPPPCGAFSPDGKGGTRTFGQTLAGLSEEFSALLDRRVDDRTGIEGTFDIHLDVDFFLPGLFTRFDRRSAAGDTSEQPGGIDPLEALGGAVQKLGLRLETANGPETFIVIDRVEWPSEN